MPKTERYGITFDSDLELSYYDYLKENNVKFMYQNEYKKTPIQVNLGKRKTYTPDFILFLENEIKIVETKGWNKWGGNVDNEIMDFMNNKVLTDSPFLASWLESINVDTLGKKITYQRIKNIKGVGFVDYSFDTKAIARENRKAKMQSKNAEIKELQRFKKDTIKYFDLIKKTKLTQKQNEFISLYENTISSLIISEKVK